MGLPISEDEVQLLREAAPVVLMELYGINPRRPFRCPNPNHDDKTPSASYDAKTTRVYCFGCDESWDAFDLVELHDGISGFVEQAHRVADLAGIVIRGEYEYESRAARRRRLSPKSHIDHPIPDKSALPNLYGVCFDAFCNLYKGDGYEARRYLHYRGFDDDDIKRYGFGFTSNPKAISSHFNLCEPDAIGFITIPYFDRNRKTVRYVALRTLTGDLPCKQKEWRPKGVSVPIWQEYLLGMNLQAVYVTEGVFDAVALQKLTGFPCVALGSTMMTGRLLGILANQTPDTRPITVALLLDNDDAGRKATSKLEAKLDELHIKHCSPMNVLGESKDPNDLLISQRGKSWDFEEGMFDAGLNYCDYIKTKWF